MIDGAIQSYVSLLRGCIRSKSLLEGRRLHQRMLQDGLLAKSIYLSNLLLLLYGSSSSMADAIGVFEAMGSENRNVYTWNILVAAFANSGLLQEAAAAFRTMPRRDLVSWTTVFKAFSNAGLVDEARGVFDRMPETDIVAWNALLDAYARNGQMQESGSVFFSMPQRSIISWTVLLTAATRVGGNDLVQQIADRIPSWDPISWNTIIAANASRGEINTAEAMFEAIPDSHLAASSSSWNAMIQAYARQGRGDLAIYLFRLMDLEGAKPSSISHAVALGAVEDLEVGRAIHASIVDEGIESVGAVGIGLVQMYSRCQHPELSKVAFDGITRCKGIVAWTALLGAFSDSDAETSERIFKDMPVHDTIAANFMIAAYANFGQMQDAMVVFNTMEERTSGSWLIIFHANQDRVEEAKAVFNRMPQADTVVWNAMLQTLATHQLVEEATWTLSCHPEPNVVAFSSLMRAYIRADRGKEAMELFAAMDLEGIQADEVALITAFEACSSTPSLLSQGQELHRESVNKVNVSTKLQTAVLDMYSKSGDLDAMMDLLVAMHDVDRDAVWWNATMSALGQHGHGALALQLAWVMAQDGRSLADELTFVNLLSGLAHSGRCEEGGQLFSSMVSDFEVQAGPGHFMAMVSLLCRGGRVAEAAELMESMPFEPDTEAWTMLLSSCAGCSGGDQLLKTSSLLQDDSASYVLVSNIHSCAAGAQL